MLLKNVSMNNSALDVHSLPFHREYYYISNILNPAWPTLILVGLISNTINMIVFLKAGIKDSVTTLLFTLSISDGFFLILIAPTMLMSNSSNSLIMSVYVMSYWPAMTCYDYSSYISVFLGVTRCACVVKPLHFKSMFTKSRTIVAVIILFCIDVLFHIPVLSISRLGWRTDPITNNSILTIISDNRAEQARKMRINDVVNKNSIAWTSFIVMIACVVLLSFKLVESSKVRSTPSGNPRSDEARGRVTTKQHQLSPRDVHVVKSVVLVCTIFIVAQLPSVCYSIARVTLAEFIVGGNLFWLISIALKVSLTCYMANASLNIFVYYKYNRMYRTVFRSLLSLPDKKIKSQRN